MDHPDRATASLANQAPLRRRRRPHEKNIASASCNGRDKIGARRRPRPPYHARPISRGWRDHPIVLAPPSAQGPSLVSQVGGQLVRGGPPAANSVDFGTARQQYAGVDPGQFATTPTKMSMFRHRRMAIIDAPRRVSRASVRNVDRQCLARISHCGFRFSDNERDDHGPRHQQPTEDGECHCQASSFFLTRRRPRHSGIYCSGTDNICTRIPIRGSISR